MSAGSPVLALSRGGRGPLGRVPPRDGDWFALDGIATQSVDYVLCDDVDLWPRDRVTERLEQIWRVLRPGGVLRIATEDLEAQVHAYWLGAASGGSGGSPCAAFNAWLHAAQGRFVYDEAELTAALTRAGFVEPRRFIGGASAHPVFWDDAAADARALVVEAQRPKGV